MGKENKLDTSNLDINVIIQSTATLIGAFGVTIAFIKSVEKWINRPNKNKEELEKLKTAAQMQKDLKFLSKQP